MLGDLSLKARMTTEKLNKIEGVRCNELMGAMYAFPRIFLPDQAIADAKVGYIACRNFMYSGTEKCLRCVLIKLGTI